MKKLLHINIIFFTFLITFESSIFGQFQCTVGNPPISKGLKSTNVLPANVDVVKTIKIIVHFPLKTDGTGNFTETTDYNGITNQYTGYWLANKFIERANAWLNSNTTMTQQLSYKPPIPVNPINIQFKLAGVIFHRDNNLYNNKYLAENYLDINNRDVSINIFLYPGGWGTGAAPYLGADNCWVSGTQSAYNDYLTYGNWGIDNAIVHTGTHEIGHCLTLKHPKQYNNGQNCTDDNPACLDDCDDTPTYLELLNDGYPNPCLWNGQGYSNNLMDYSPLQVAWTPCQIGKVHTEIENNRRALYPCGYNTDVLTITSNISSLNKSYIARTIRTSNIIVSQSKALYINCETFETTGTFEVSVGGIFEVNTAPKCN